MRCALTGDETLAGDFCFVFYLQSEEFVLTGDFSALLVGGGPSIIDRRNGKITKTGSGHPTEDLVSNYEKYGDPYAFQNLTNNVILKSWIAGASSIKAIKILRSEIKDLGLAEAKLKVEECLNGDNPIVLAETTESAANLVSELKKVGFVAEQVIEDRS